jgi:hypothetical protein
MRLYESLTAQQVELYGPAGTWRPVKRLLLLATLLAVVLPATANAAGSPCRNKVFNDWYPDGKIASTYPVGCYRDALKHIHTDADVYSSLRDDIRAAMRASIRRSQGLPAPQHVGHGPAALGAGRVKGTLQAISKTASGNTTTPHDPAPTGVVATTTGAPLPILVLGGLALALAAAGAIGLGVRHARGRR